MLWPLVVLLALSALVLFAFAASPQQVRQCGAVMDKVIAGTVDEWLGCDTLTIPGLRPWDFPAFVLFEPVVSSWGPVSGPPSPPLPPPADGVLHSISSGQRRRPPEGGFGW